MKVGELKRILKEMPDFVDISIEVQYPSRNDYEKFEFNTVMRSTWDNNRAVILIDGEKE